jgi:lipoate-protein ligase A
MLWRNRPAVILGRFQNTYEEVDVEYAAAHDIAVVRRMSGGGAVYQDLGNLNFSFVVETSQHPFNDYEAFTRPVIETLAVYGVRAELTGRNDLVINGAKFSGNAQFRTPTHLLHHGTVLFDTDLEVVGRVLTVAPDKIQSKGIKSVRSRVTNVRPHLPPGVDIEAFQDRLLANIIAHLGGEADWHHLTPEEEAAVQREVAARFGQWEWNFGQSPPFNYVNRERFPAGSVEVRLEAVKGRVASVKIYGDFLGDRDIAPLEEALVGAPFDRASLAERVEALDVPSYLGGITAEQLLTVLHNLAPSDHTP